MVKELLPDDEDVQEKSKKLDLAILNPQFMNIFTQTIMAPPQPDMGGEEGGEEGYDDENEDYDEGGDEEDYAQEEAEGEAETDEETRPELDEEGNLVG